MIEREVSKPFYNSSAWIKCRDGYMQSKHYICERCGDVATICHHKEYITPDNIHDPYITLNWENLEAVCQTCHNQEHFGSKTIREGLTFDSNGNITGTDVPPIDE